MFINQSKYQIKFNSVVCALQQDKYLKKTRQQNNVYTKTPIRNLNMKNIT